LFGDASRTRRPRIAARILPSGIRRRASLLLRRRSSPRLRQSRRLRQKNQQQKQACKGNVNSFQRFFSFILN